MASQTSSGMALFLALNLLFFSMASACGGGCPNPKPTPTNPPTPKPTPPNPRPTPPTPRPTPSTPKPTPPSGSGKCPIDALKLGVCADVLANLLNLKLGSPPVQPCCSLINGLVDVEAAVCLCTAIKANILGINLNVPVSLSLLLNACNHKLPSGFQCP
ncbi:unnamed protein product [Linum tenue]|uniref:Bifunctional inhibitor/plant lipid transfer protein/seed storage helical domain-containing protein n=1 Tax=Linum tenue TaxID=586396 RepID=A0AAV0Q1Z5_9ROSI|nr:unnamed protein product [Linum tenue]CAI0489133.1 unnamed protein product [Linum tenue]